MYDMVIRGGTIVDGSGSAEYLSSRCYAGTNTRWRYKGAAQRAGPSGSGAFVMLTNQLVQGEVAGATFRYRT